MDALAVIRKGRGPEILLVHGEGRPHATWEALAPLRARWTLAVVHRRGYRPSPRLVNGRQDFGIDAVDLASLLTGRPHLVAQAYGALGALLAAARRPTRVRSLTLIEPPLFYLAPVGAALATLRETGIPMLVASGDHSAGIERACDAFARALGAQRLVAPGAGCLVAAAPGFAARLQRFLLSAG